MNAYERLMLETIPQGFPKPVDTSNGPTACAMRVERQRLLWQLAHGDDAPQESPVRSVLSADRVPVADMNTTHAPLSVGFPVEQEAG